MLLQCSQSGGFVFILGEESRTRLERSDGAERFVVELVPIFGAQLSGIRPNDGGFCFKRQISKQPVRRFVISSDKIDRATAKENERQKNEREGRAQPSPGLACEGRSEKEDHFPNAIGIPRIEASIFFLPPPRQVALNVWNAASPRSPGCRHGLRRRRLGADAGKGPDRSTHPLAASGKWGIARHTFQQGRCRRHGQATAVDRPEE